MSRFTMKLVPHTFQYEAMPLEIRKALLPERSVCSLAPSADYADSFATGNGFHSVDLLGDPYNEEIGFTQEMLYEPMWLKAPEPPDLTDVLPTVRRLLLEGKADEAADLVEKKQIECGLSPSVYKGSRMPLWSCACTGLSGWISGNRRPVKQQTISAGWT